MKETLKLIIVLTVICLLAGFALAGVYSITRNRISLAKQQEMLAALENVLPDYDNKPIDNKFETTESGNEWIFYIARKDGIFSGAAFETSSIQGYGGIIKVMVGIGADNNIEAIEILEQTETPGLGAKIETEEFKGQFRNKGVVNLDWCKVRKDGGEIDAITGATISSRAVAEALRKGLESFEKYRSEIEK
ncbi:RnfABCDGE type electron transport complex subunit G [Verrucomicrobiota bacterium]